MNWLNRVRAKSGRDFTFWLIYHRTRSCSRKGKKTESSSFEKRSFTIRNSTGFFLKLHITTWIQKTWKKTSKRKNMNTTNNYSEKNPDTKPPPGKALLHITNGRSHFLHLEKSYHFLHLDFWPFSPPRPYYLRKYQNLHYGAFLRKYRFLHLFLEKIPNSPHVSILDDKYTQP